MMMRPASVTAPSSRRLRQGKTIYLIACIICELQGLSLVFLQFYGAHRLMNHDEFNESYGQSMANYGFCLPLTTGLLLIFNSSLAILIQWLDKSGATSLPWLRSLVGPWFILTATVGIVTFVIAVIQSAAILHVSSASSGEMITTAALALLSAVTSYCLSCTAFFAGHACCYCVRNNHTPANYIQMQTI
ncbi:uncharacterized protein LOC134182272 [Corticium candelabrum]|uniref:uncharacterized protein LOC134182272 n=1 Tax=Corticium candelabrum TaxID=121492 RepID=UPI002E26CEB0|nr:uncharacterized protein LOC134182272 [Corticium candelabrum]